MSQVFGWKYLVGVFVWKDIICALKKKQDVVDGEENKTGYYLHTGRGKTKDVNDISCSSGIYRSVDEDLLWREPHPGVSIPRVMAKIFRKPGL